jgi:hypothetical protein
MELRRKRLASRWLALAAATLGAGILVFYHRMTTLPPGPEGIWQLAETRGRPGVMAFRFDGQTVTLFLINTGDFPGRPPDGCYRLQARWQGEDLSIRLPTGAWQHLVSFVEGRFIGKTEAAGRAAAYRKVRPTGLAENERALVEDRPVWDYSTLMPDF